MRDVQWTYFLLKKEKESPRTWRGWTDSAHYVSFSLRRRSPARRRTRREERPPPAAVAMKRFFQPVPKDGSPAKKRPASSDSDSLGGDAPALSPAAAACAIGEGDSPPAPREEEPRRFVTWNANSLLLRMKSDWPAFCQFVSRVDPDVICVQVSGAGAGVFGFGRDLLPLLFIRLLLPLGFNLQCCADVGIWELVLGDCAAMWHMPDLRSLTGVSSSTLGAYVFVIHPWEIKQGRCDLNRDWGFSSQGSVLPDVHRACIALYSHAIWR